MSCDKCGDTKWYTPQNQRGTVKAWRCPFCCKHEGERWKLSQYHAHPGKWCCAAGCGQVWESKTGNAVVKKGGHEWS